MSKNEKRKNTGKVSKSVNNKQKKKIDKDEKRAIFDEISDDFNNGNKKKGKKRKKHKILRGILTIILVAFLILVGFFVIRMNENGWSMGGFVATILGHDSKTASKLPRVNVLLIGQSQNLTDTLLVCTFDPKTQDFGMLSIPRDTFVGRNKNNATAWDKINAIYQTDPKKLLTKVNEITGLNIQYYIKVDTKGFRELVDSIGGVYFDVPVDMDYDDCTQDLYIHVKAGYQLLNGEKAEHVVRFRHNNDGSSYSLEYGEQDLGRMRTQRAFITEVMKQLVKVENITKIDQFIKIANENVETNFNLWDLKDYAPYLLDLNLNELNTAALPGVPEKLNRLWFFTYNKKESEAIIKDMFKTGKTAEQEKNSNIKVSVLNGTNDDTNMENVEKLLREYGYDVVSTGVTTSMKTTTIINRTNQDSSIAEELKDVIGLGVISNSSSSNNTTSKNSVDFTIIIGADY